MLPHLPILQVIIPMIAAALCVIMPRGGMAWVVAVIGNWLTFGVAMALFLQTSHHHVIYYELGDWVAPYGIQYRVDRLAVFMFMIVSFVGAIAILFARDSVEQDVPKAKQPLFYTLYLLCMAGLLGIVGTNDAFNLYVFLEISSLATYALIAMGRDRRALSSSFQYLIIGTIGATFFLIGVGLLYMMTGTLNISDLAQRLPDISDTKPVLAAFAFIVVGLSMKIALFPLHMWLPNAYSFAPHFVSVFIAATATKVGVYALIRMLLSLFGYEFTYETMPLGEILLLLSVPAILVGSFVAIYQLNIKRMLAYSSVAQIGYIVMGLGLGTFDGLRASIVHLANHGITKAALFMVVGCVAYSFSRVGITKLKITSFYGIARHMPFTSMAFVFAGLALIGVPLSGGFISKWYLLNAAVDDGWWIMALVVVAGSLLALIYIWRVVDAMYFAQPGPRSAALKEAPPGMLIPTWMMVLASWYVGIDTQFTAAVATEAAQILLADSMPVSPGTMSIVSGEVQP